MCFYRLLIFEHSRSWIQQSNKFIKANIKLINTNELKFPKNTLKLQEINMIVNLPSIRVMTNRKLACSRTNLKVNVLR